jgi:Uncharacterized protein conserved in bacteria
MTVMLHFIIIFGGVMEKIVRQTLLFDFYGELLNEHQKSVYGDIISSDLSYSEFAVENNISRQAVFDMVKRCNDKLEAYEKKLGLVERFMTIRNRVEELSEIINSMKDDCSDKKLIGLYDELLEKSGEIVSEL